MMKKAYSWSGSFNEDSFLQSLKKIHQIKFCQFTPLQIENHPVSKKNKKKKKKKSSSRLNQLQLNV